MMDPDDKFLVDFHANGKEKGLKILEAGVTVTTPQGTVPLEDYGSIAPQFNCGEIKGFNLVGGVDKITGVMSPETKRCIMASLGVGSGNYFSEQMHPTELNIEFSAVQQTGPEAKAFADRFLFRTLTEEECKVLATADDRNEQRFIDDMKTAFHVPQSYIDSMPPRDPQTNEVIVHKPRAMGKTMGMASTNQVIGRLKRSIDHDGESCIMTVDLDKIEMECEVVKKIVNPKYQIRDNFNRRNPLPSLEAINANIADAWGRYMFTKRSRENVLKHHLEELKRMSDHELQVYINLARSRANTISGGRKFPSQLDMEKYVMALEEQDDRRREHYNKI